MRNFALLLIFLGMWGSLAGQDSLSWQELNKRGYEAFQKGKYKEALRIFKKAKTQAKKEFGRVHKNYVEACNNAGFLYQIEGKYTKTESLYKEAIEIYSKVLGKNDNIYATAINNLGHVYYKQGKYLNAETLYLESKKIRSKKLGKNHPLYAQSINNLAVLYEELGRFKIAETLYLESKKIRRLKVGEKSNDFASSLNNLAGLYLKLGKYEKAQELYKKASIIYKSNSSKRLYILSLNNLGGLYQALGNYNKAEKFFLEAKDRRRSLLGKNHPDYALSLSNLAYLYEAKNELKKAELLLYNAIKIRVKILGKNHPDYATSLNNLAALQLGMVNYVKAESLYVESKEIRSKVLGKNHPDYAQSLNSLAGVYELQGKFFEAKALYEKAKQIRLNIYGKQHLKYITLSSDLAMLNNRLKLYNKANTLFMEVFQILRSTVKKNLFFLSKNEKHFFLKANLNNLYQSYHYFAQAHTDSLTIPKSKKVLALQYNNRLLTKALLFNSTQKTKERIYASGDTTVINQYEAFIAKRIFYNKILELPITERKKRGVDLATLAEEANDLEKALARQSKDFAKELEEYKAHTWKEVKRVLKSGEAAIEIIRYNWHDKKWTDKVHYVALIVTPKSPFPYPIYFDNGNFLESKGFQDYQFFTKNQKNAPKAYARFWQPIQTQLKKLYPKVQRVFISLDGIYHQLNLKTLWNPATQKYLGDELDIRLVSNTKDLLKRKTKNKAMASHHKAEVQLFGYPDYSRFAHTARKPSQYDGFFGKTNERDLREFFKNGIIRRLPDTQKEVQQIGRILATHRIPHRVYLDTNATETKLKAVRSPKVLHLATHGYFINHNDLKDLRKQRQWAGTEFKQYVANPLLRAGLVWTGAQATLKGETRPQNVPDNGILTAQEVLNLNLDSTQLVVLSACETGLGKVENGRRVYGLQRAFLSAGAQYVLMSLWKVDDEVTNYFMQYFYEAWAKTQDVRQAHRYAQQQLRTSTQGKYNSPYYWGAFVLVEK